MIFLLATLCCGLQDDNSLYKVVKLLDPITKQQTAIIEQITDPLKVPEKSPKSFGDEHWLFGWQTVAYETLIPERVKYARFSIFSQERNSDFNPEIPVARMLERLWEYGYRLAKKDHSMEYDGLVEVFLCNGGTPGGEQLFDKDQINGDGRHQRKVNTIYLYDLPTFKNPLEMAREVAHEYGHATLEGVNGYKEPEDWASGFLGERLFLKHIAEGMRAKTLEPDDAMGATLADIDRYLSLNVNPLVEQASQSGPDPTTLKARNGAGMKAYMGLALYIDTIMPERTFFRAMEILPSRDAEDLPEAISVAAEEVPTYTLQIPSYLKGKNLWIPLGSGQIRGAKVLKRSNRWAYISPLAPGVTVTQKQDPN